MNISEDILIIFIVILAAVGFIESGGHPSLPVGIITWPVAFFLLLLWFIKKLADKSVLVSIGLSLFIYLIIGIPFAIFGVTTLPTYVPGAGPSVPTVIIYAIFTWPALLFGFFGWV